MRDRLAVLLAAVADDSAVDFDGVLLADRTEAKVALPIEPGIALARIDLEYGLKFSAATVHAASDHRHTLPPLFLEQNDANVMPGAGAVWCQEDGRLGWHGCLLRCAQ